MRDCSAQLSECGTPVLHIVVAQNVRAKCIIDPKKSTRVVWIPSSLEIPRTGQRKYSAIRIFRRYGRNDCTYSGFSA
ncbi:hypothetical protein GCM10011499_18180 [Pelagibacterium lentulum]|uniref:Uncharacterized protein n=1 Tax=Pelagibacterium lentulum TaxID=2029865 RepID=A0A916RAM8_9HYPH|nr:hypothetical protein GCM10011499_18180 [Pelagibacterium lentulum]